MYRIKPNGQNLKHMGAATKFAEVQRQLEAVLAELKDTTDPNLTRQKLLDIRLLLAKADCVTSENQGQP